MEMHKSVIDVSQYAYALKTITHAAGLVHLSRPTDFSEIVIGTVCRTPRQISTICYNYFFFSSSTLDTLVYGNFLKQVAFSCLLSPPVRERRYYRLVCK